MAQVQCSRNDHLGKYLNYNLRQNKIVKRSVFGVLLIAPFLLFLLLKTLEKGGKWDAWLSSQKSPIDWLDYFYSSGLPHRGLSKIGSYFIDSNNHGNNWLPHRVLSKIRSYFIDSNNHGNNWLPHRGLSKIGSYFIDSNNRGNNWLPHRVLSKIGSYFIDSNNHGNNWLPHRGLSKIGSHFIIIESHNWISLTLTIHLSDSVLFPHIMDQHDTTSSRTPT